MAKKKQKQVGTTLSMPPTTTTKWRISGTAEKVDFTAFPSTGYLEFDTPELAAEHARALCDGGMSEVLMSEVITTVKPRNKFKPCRSVLCEKIKLCRE